MACRVNEAQKFNQPLIPTDSIANGITEPGEQKAPDLATPRPPSRWRLHDAVNCPFGLINQLAAKTAALLLKIPRGLNQFDLERRVKPPLHEREVRALPKTSAWVFGCTAPRAISSDRHSATASAASSSNSVSRRRTSSRSVTESLGNSARISALLIPALYPKRPAPQAPGFSRQFVIQCVTSFRSQDGRGRRRARRLSFPRARAGSCRECG